MSNPIISRRNFLELVGAATLAWNATSPLTRAADSTPLYAKLPRWRGFNLLEKFNGGAPFREDDFRNISDLGFNFVRLPMNYKLWIQDGDWRKFDEKTLAEIDQAVEFGKKYGVHVCINFHRAPGYTVNTPPENPLIWQSDEALDVCKLHWQTFAKRYRGIPSEELSFNLFNEPANCSEEDYYRVVKTILEGIRQEDPDRLVICDGIEWAGKPCFSFKDLRVAQATRGYAPMEISHYGANWVNSKNFPEPQWPFYSFNGLMPSPNKREMPEGIRQPLLIDGEFAQGGKLRVKIGIVSNNAELVVSFDGKEALRRKFVSGPGKGEWQTEVYVERYKIYQNVFNLDLTLDIPKGAKQISIANVAGDWLTIAELAVATPSCPEVVSTGTTDWNAVDQTKLRYFVEKDRAALVGGTTRDREWLRRQNVEPWRKLAEQGVGVMVGEFGAFNRTPHKIALAWLEDMLANWREQDWGWALWNFRGPFGIADSGRDDVDYEDWRGLKLDREMLSLLQRY